MGIRAISLYFLSLLIFLDSHAQEKSPLLKGKVNLSIKQGTIECDFTLTDLPLINNYYIRINSGMNIRYIRNLEDNYNFVYEKDYNDTTRHESFGYYMPNKTGNVIRDGYQFSYVGKFPVIADTLKAANSGDWKGNIAFNGYSVRADGRQSAWYPIFYNKSTDQTYDEVRCDIEINCSDCNAIYINGNMPVKGENAHFKNDNPKQLLLFAGIYNVIGYDSTYFLNPDIDSSQIKEFGVITNQFKEYYERKLRIAYAEHITYIQTTPTSKRNSWMFVTYPTIVNIGWGEYGMKSLFNEKSGVSAKIFIAHELGHYYFGSYKRFNSELGDMLSEGFGEYLSLQITREFFGDSLYNAKIERKIKLQKNFKPVAFSKIKNHDNYADRELYVYHYAPLIFTAIEHEIGMDNMWKWMHTILVSKQDFTDFAFLEYTLASTLNHDKKLQTIKEKYFSSDMSLENAISTIQQKH